MNDTNLPDEKIMTHGKYSIKQRLEALQSNPSNNNHYDPASALKYVNMPQSEINAENDQPTKDNQSLDKYPYM